MNTLGQWLDARDDAGARRQRELDAKKAGEVWQLRGERPEARLVAFDRWLRRELEARIDWAWAGEQRERRIEQCRIELERMVRDLWRRGWALDGKALARRIEGMLDAIGAYQRRGKVEDFWAYFSASVRRYVGQNAEEIADEARRVGAHVGDLMALLKPQPGPSLPELVAQRAQEVGAGKAETLRARVARERARKGATDAQRELF